ncbi:MAG: nucleotidyltransferase family protein [Clostridia bacterium]|nr:nucleotidyltransferase family protein [Clostridia bacterium]
MSENNALKTDMGKTALNMICSVLNSTPLPRLPEEFDWDSFCSFVKEHNISSIIYFAVKQMKNVPAEIVKIFEEVYLRACLKTAVIDVEIPALLDAFEKGGVRHMVLKGFIMRDYYPDPIMRSMGDVDILVGSDLEKAHQIMIESKYKFHSEGFLHSNYSKPNVYIELHKSLVDEYFDTMYRYYGEGFEKARIADGYKYRYVFSDEDFYIFLLAHVAKHFKISGTGIRSIMDIYVFRKKFSSLDEKYIDAELSKMGLLTFKNKIEETAFSWFSKPFDGEFDAVGEYIITSGVYGQVDNHELNAFILNTFKDTSYKKGKLKYILNMIFPGREYIGARYPKAKKHPVLIPFYWVVRFFSTMFRSRGSIRYRLKGVSESDESALKKFDDTGLR